MGVNKYGAAVIGDEAADEQQEIVRMGKDKYGPAILDHPGTEGSSAKAPAELEDGAGAEPYVNVESFVAALGEDPEKVVPLLEHELARASGPRKGALHALRRVEASEVGHNRPDVLAMIDDEIG